MCLGELECLREQGSGGVPVTLERGQPTRHVQSASTHTSRCCTGRFRPVQHALQPDTTLPELPAHHPVEAHAPCQAETKRSIVLAISPLQRRPDVVQFSVQACHGAHIAGSEWPIMDGDGEAQHVRSMGSTHRTFCGLAAGGQPLETELTHRLQHLVARLPGKVRRSVHQAVIDQRGDPIEHLWGAGGGAGHWRYTRNKGLRRSQREPSHKHREAAKKLLLCRRKEVVTPGNGVSHGLLAEWQVTRGAAEEWQPLIQALQQGIKRQSPQPGRRQFDSQRQTIHPPHNFGDQRHGLIPWRELGTHMPCSLDKELHRAGLHSHRRNRKLSFARDT